MLIFRVKVCYNDYDFASGFPAKAVKHGLASPSHSIAAAKNRAASPKSPAPLRIAACPNAPLGEQVHKLLVHLIDFLLKLIDASTVLWDFYYKKKASGLQEIISKNY